MVGRVTRARRSFANTERRAGTDAPYQQSDFHITSEKPLRVVKHSITRYRITLEARQANLPPTRRAGGWRSPASGARSQNVNRCLHQRSTKSAASSRSLRIEITKLNLTAAA